VLTGAAHLHEAGEISGRSSGLRRFRHMERDVEPRQRTGRYQRFLLPDSGAQGYAFSG
jgi:hypothetical protein